MATKPLGSNFRVVTGPDGKKTLQRINRYPSVSARLAAKKKKTWKPAK